MGLDADEIARSHLRAWARRARTVPRWWVRREDGSLGVMTGVELGGFNGVWGEAKDVDPAAVARLLASVRQAGVPYCMQLRPGWPREMDEIAREHGIFP